MSWYEQVTAAPSGFTEQTRADLLASRPDIPEEELHRAFEGALRELEGKTGPHVVELTDSGVTVTPLEVEPLEVHEARHADAVQALRDAEQLEIDQAEAEHLAAVDAAERRAWEEHELRLELMRANAAKESSE